MTASRMEAAGAVRLEPLTLACAPFMLRWMQDPEVSRNIALRKAATLASTEAWIARAIQDESIRPFAIRSGDAYVGNVILDRIDPYISSARFSIYIGDAAARGKGVAAAAIELVLREAFTVLRLNKVWLMVHARNFRAINLYQKAGFVLEGILREEVMLDGERIAALYMSILRREFASK
jgi:RimJ/RimL family protein N-acetyltransferase